MKVNNIAVLKVFQNKFNPQPTTKAEQDRITAIITALVNKAKSGQKLSRAEMAQLRELSPSTAESVKMCEKVREEEEKRKLQLELRIEESRAEKREEENGRLKQLKNKRKYDSFET